MSKKEFYNKVESNPDFAKIDSDIISYWKENSIFQESVDSKLSKDQKGDNNEFVFYDGPPFANGLPHYGHLLTGYVKDIFARYQTIKGKKVERRFGWDCHGLPAEMGAEKELNISGRHQILDYGIDKFNDHCRKSVMKYTDQWEEYVEKQARWVDFENDYKTMDINYMESVLWAFKQLYDKGLVYESMRVMPYSWACQTPLSNFETRLDNSYREKKSKAITVLFNLKNAPNGAPRASSYKILAWTTTPWTLPSNLALAVSKDIEYACYVKNDVCYVLALSSLKSSYAKDLGLEEDAKIKTIKGDSLIGLSYEPLFKYFENHENAFRVLEADFVEEGDGTGVVHLAPGFGEDDQRVCEAYDIKLVCPVDNAGQFTNEVPDYEGSQVFDANDDIIISLKEQGSWLKTEQYIHNYPHCWRTDTPLIYKAVPSWYVEVTKFKDRMVELNQQINWIPDHIKDGQFGKWLDNARDWSISRNRFWGSPIPIWRSDDPKYPRIDVYGSIEELEKDFSVKVTDLHRPFIDELTRPNPDDPTGKSMMRRVEDVFDCWFESGSMPYAQVHYPFENKEWFEGHFPADFIVEYVAQTRGWFYTLMVLSTALFDRPPFLNCICHGVVLDDKGQKLSKRLNNYADPKDIFDQYGSDALRWVMVSSPIMHGGELLIDKECKMVHDAVRLVLKPVWNAYNFFVLYANADGLQAQFDAQSSNYNNVMDRYILAKCKSVVVEIERALDEFDTPAACKVIEGFFDVLNNWYIRRNKDRYWKSEKDEDKQRAYDALYSVIHILVRAFSPLLPIISEEIWRCITNAESSVHLQDFPDVSSIDDDLELISDVDRVRNLCNAALSVRSAENIRVRQPLASLRVVADNTGSFARFEELIKDEINVKSLEYSNNVEEYADYNLKINFPVLGKRLPKKMKEIIAESKKGGWQLQDDGAIKIAGEILTDDECQFALAPKNKQGAESLSGNDALVILDLNITDELRSEGLSRDIVRLVQQSRKDADLQITDRISLSVSTDSESIINAVESHKQYIAEQVLSDVVNVNDNETKSDYTFDKLVEGDKLVIGFSLV